MPRAATTAVSSLVVLVLALLSHVHAATLRSLAEGHTGGSGSSHAEAGAKSTSHEAKVESPSTSSFTGPLLAGALAIVLIGLVVKFRSRAAANQ